MTARLKSTPLLSHSQLAFRIGLARKRLSLYPLDKLDFIMMDLERPEMCSRHAHWCTGDLTGRMLEFLSCADGIDGNVDARLHELFERILRAKRPSGLFGRSICHPSAQLTIEEHVPTWSYRLFNALIKYHDLTGDYRALDAAVATGEWFLKNADRFMKAYEGGAACPMEFWVSEPLAELYRITRDSRYLDFIGMLNERISGCDYIHTHGFLATMRGLQLAAIYTGDTGWNEKPEHYRRVIIDKHYETADGCVTEVLPRSFRNEGCAIADWLMLNLNAGFISGDAEPYERAENILWNAMFFNQFITGGFGHRDVMPNGYAMGPVAEAWWCCTEHCGLAMSEYAMHAVTLHDNVLRINLLTSGKFVAGGIELQITTSYPSSAATTIVVDKLPENVKIAVRVPSCVQNAEVREARTANGAQVYLSGSLGHNVYDYEDKALLKYGPLILSPQVKYWNPKVADGDGNVPAGYIPSRLPEGPALCVGNAKPGDRLDYAQTPIPDWSNFERGPGTELWIEGASVNVPVSFSDGSHSILWFSPLCVATSNLSLYDTPILFDRI